MKISKLKENRAKTIQGSIAKNAPIASQASKFSADVLRTRLYVEATRESFAVKASGVERKIAEKRTSGDSVLAGGKSQSRRMLAHS